MWALNLCFPTGFLIFVLGVIGMLDLNQSPDSDRPEGGETTDDVNDTVVATRDDPSLCRLTITIVVLLTCAVLGCLLLDCLSARVGTFIVAFMLATLAMTCEQILPGS